MRFSSCLICPPLLQEQIILSVKSMNSSILRFFGIEKKQPIQTQMLKIFYKDSKDLNLICHVTICHINLKQCLLFIYHEENQSTNNAYRIGYIYQGVDSFKERPPTEINHLMKSHSWEVKIIEEIERLEDEVNIFFASSLESDINIKFDSDLLAEMWYDVLTNIRNLQLFKQKMEEERKRNVSQALTNSQPHLPQLKGMGSNIATQSPSSIPSQFRASQFGSLISNTQNEQMLFSIEDMINGTLNRRSRLG